MTEGQIKDLEWKKTNKELISKIHLKINSLNQKRVKGELTDEECLDQKPKCYYQNSPYHIVGYSYNVGNHQYLQFCLRDIEEQSYCTIYAYNLEPNLIFV